MFIRSAGVPSLGNIFVAGVLLAAFIALVGCASPAIAPPIAAPEAASPASTQQDQPERGRLLFMVPDSQANLQLGSFSLASGTPATLTEAPYGIMDYGVAGDGQTVVYSAWREDGGLDLRAVQIDGQNDRLLVSCDNAACGRIAWLPSGDQFTFEKHGDAGGGATSALWRFDWARQSAEPLAVPAGAQAGINASWSPDGRWLSYFLADRGMTEAVNLADGRKFELASSLGDPVAWQPSGESLVWLEIRPDGDQMLAHMMRLDLTTGEQEDIGAPRMADFQPAWSPTGEWLAVTRWDWTEGYPSKTQIWLMRADGAEAHPVLADPDIQYLSPVWSADGRFLLFQRYTSDQTFVQPEVWMLDLDSGQTTRTLPSAGQVVWLP